MIPSYLNDLDLDKVFETYTSTPDLYLEESDKNEHIVDSESQKISGFVSPSFGSQEDKANKFFAVENTSACQYALLKIDNGLIQTEKTKKCDCAIVNRKEICFIEFKANATSLVRKTIVGNYLKAIDQLSTTIRIFNNYYATIGKDIKSLRKVEAYICFRAGYPRSTASQMNYKLKFMARNNGITLSFERKKAF